MVGPHLGMEPKLMFTQTHWLVFQKLHKCIDLLFHDFMWLNLPQPDVTIWVGRLLCCVIVWWLKDLLDRVAIDTLFSYQSLSAEVF